MMDAAMVAAFAALFIHNADHYAVQQRNGSYWHVPEPLTLALVAAHLSGRITLGTYVLDRASCCRFAVFDADSEDGLEKLAVLQQWLAMRDVSSLLETSRRGGHLWVHFTEATPAAQVRAWLWPLASEYGTELYPKQDRLNVGGSGSLIRLPLGVHRKSRGWYPFVADAGDGLLMPVGETVEACGVWACETVQRVAVPEVGLMEEKTDQEIEVKVARGWPDRAAMASHEHIREWCEAHDCRAVIGRFVDLDRHGMGSCPFKAHHAHGDRRPSFQVFADHWYCYTWGRAGNLFDFVCLYYNLSAQAAWQRLQMGWQP